MIGRHGPEFIEIEQPALSSHTQLPENNRPRTGAADREGNEKHQRPENTKPEKGKEDVQSSFNKTLTNRHIVLIDPGEMRMKCSLRMTESNSYH